MKNRFFAACSFGVLTISGFLSSDGARGAAAGDRQPPQVVEEFDIAKGGDLILVPVTIGHDQYPFVLATNCDRTIVDVRLRHLLGKSLGEMDGNGDLAHWEEFAPIPMKIGKLGFSSRFSTSINDSHSSGAGTGGISARGWSGTRLPLKELGTRPPAGETNDAGDICP